MDYEFVKAELVRWAGAEDNIRAILITGSAARGQTDALSDLDIELYVRDAWPLFTQGAWYERLGDVLVVEALANPERIPTRLVYYVGGKLDFGIAYASSLTGSHHARPFEVLVDKDGVASALAVDAAKEASLCSDIAMMRAWDTNQNLLRMTELGHKARYGLSYDTWFLGKHLQRWADHDVVADVKRCFAKFDTSQIAEALVSSTDLFEKLAVTTGRAIAAPLFNNGKVRAEVDNILARRLA